MKGAHIFHLRKKEYAKEWLRNLDIKHYKPSLQSLNVNFEPSSQPTRLSPSPGASINDIPESSSQLHTKQLPQESWQMVQKLSLVLAKSIPKTKTKIPFKFNQHLHDIYERERTPQPSQSTSVASRTRSHDTEPSIPARNVTEHKTSRKRVLSDPPSDQNDETSTHNQDNIAATNPVQRPAKKLRPAHSNVLEKKSRSINNVRTAGKTPPTAVQPASKKCPPARLEVEKSPSPLLNGHDGSPRKAPIRKSITLDWKKNVPQALVLDFLPNNKYCPKMGIWFLPLQMVCFLHYFFPLSLYLLLGSQQKNFDQHSMQQLKLHNLLANQTH